MKRIAFTPGPYRVVEVRDRTLYVNAGNIHVAKVCGSTAVGAVRARFVATANLLSTAPALYEACEAIVKRHDARASEIEPGFTCGCPDCEIALAALRAARGEP